MQNVGHHKYLRCENKKLKYQNNSYPTCCQNITNMGGNSNGHITKLPRPGWKHCARKIISQNVYEKLHNKLTSTYFPEEFRIPEGERKLGVHQLLQIVVVIRQQETRANKCLLCKQITFKLFHQKFPLHWLLSTFFILLFTSLRFFPMQRSPAPSTMQSLPPRRSIHSIAGCRSGSRKNFALTTSIYAKHIIALYMITIFRNLSSKLRH